LAKAYADLGQSDEASRYIGEAMMAVDTTKERWWEADIYRMAGEIALMSSEPDAVKAEAYSSVRSRLRVSSKQSLGSCAQR
jgi:hypothetical protein